jgi:hypothetical protein
MAIPTYDFLERPLADDFMTYDFNEHRYIPLVDGILKDAYVNLVVDWGLKENAQSYLDLVSRVIYETILSFKDEKYKNTMLYYMAHSKKMRREIQKIFNDSVWYNRRDGGFMMAYNTGANLNQGKLIEFGIDKAISSIARQIIKNSPLGTRYMTVDINEKQIFSSLETLLAFLVSENYITSDESDTVTESGTLYDLPYAEDYQLLVLENDRCLFTNIKSIKSYVEDMWINDNANGTW